ncbi:MAG: iron-sulfur cluster assembly accessory protein [Elusimicrobia bacterium]|nr:iron-sulfur cluster assembly accessory protein [Elusimicrobiota bacterium]
MIILTSQAASKIKELAQKQNKPHGFLRLRVTSGGCSGLSYEFEISENTTQDDRVVEQEGAKLAVDNKSYFFVNGSVIDYVQNLMKSGFEVKNPNATSSCSCGTSFST